MTPEKCGALNVPASGYSSGCVAALHELVKVSSYSALFMDSFGGFCAEDMQPRARNVVAASQIGRVMGNLSLFRGSERLSEVLTTGRGSCYERRALLDQRRFTIAMMLPSLSLNQAALLSVNMLSTVFRPCMSYSSKTTPRFLSSATSVGTSSTAQNAWLALQ